MEIRPKSFSQKLSTHTKMIFSWTKQYRILFILQYILLLYDASVNAVVILCQNQPVDVLILYITQDLCLMVSLTILLGSFFSTYIFRVGLIYLLYSRFRLAIMLCVIYIVLSITLHSWHMTYRWPSPQIHHWNKGFHIMYATHRIVAVIYYYFYKRATLSISDPRLFQTSSWEQNPLSVS
ncbi:transmembrane protein 138 [Neodiprion virginianus]|uniref:transmembrane protein 138 n=1 Tax=Neodiprion virginianus TaxID=2961670 RepID=UPI001EE76721|nr:transmembrane protein 138 [Neodiprion virginianus]